jgi:DNA-binding transcriptional LysR family regulator
METFVRIVEMGSFSAAAKQLNVGQPAVSKSVAHLEKRLGVRLLIRSTHGLRPTEAGQTYFERARRAIEEADEADRAARGEDAGLTGRLRVTAGVAFGKLHLMPHLPEFLSAHPDLSLDLVLEDRPIDLVEEGVDMALRFGAPSKSALVGRKIAIAPRWVVGTPEYFDRAGVPMAPGELARHEAIIYMQDPGGPDAWSFNNGGTELLVSLRHRLRVTCSEAVRAAVLHGMGLAVVWRWMFGPELTSGAIRPVLTEWALPEADLWAVFPRGRMANAKTRAFTSFVDTIIRQPNLLSGTGFQHPPAAETNSKRWVTGSPAGGM